MKRRLIVLVFALAAFAQTKETPAGVPPGAVSIEGHTWRWVDKEGKAWLYRATPFGMLRTEEAKVSDAKRPAGVPAGAVAVTEGVWRSTEADGRVWLFQETPSGIMKTEEPKGGLPAVGPTGLKVADARPDAVLELITVKEEGDSLRFSRPGPFGTYSWLKKRTQLDKDETIVWERAQARASARKKD